MNKNINTEGLLQGQDQEPLSVSVGVGAVAPQAQGEDKKEDTKEEKKKAGRPTIKSDELLTFICTEITEGKSLVKICRENGFHLSTVFQWLCDDKSFSDKYARAKEEQADTLADEIIDLSDEAAILDSNPSLASAAVQAARLRVDARKWVAAKLKPKKYGDRVQAEVTHSYEERLRKRIQSRKEGAK